MSLLDLARKSIPFSVRRALKPYFDLERFFYDALAYQWKVRNADDIESAWGAYYEFGVGWMFSMKTFLSSYRRLRAKGIDPINVYGFDTFEGLPATAHAADRLEGWTPGRFATSIEACRKIVRDMGFDNVELIQGLFEQSLTPELLDRLKKDPPGIITIDVDFYTSTVTVLEFLKGVLRPGVLIYFDDVWSFNGDPSRGQVRAIREFNEQGPFYLTPHWLGLGAGHVYAVSEPLHE